MSRPAGAFKRARFTIPVLRYMKTYGLTHEQLAMVSVVQREWAARRPARDPRGGRPWRADPGSPITVEDVLNSRMIAYPFQVSKLIDLMRV
jgi:acetyl-CoA acetyltransferase